MRVLEKQVEATPPTLDLSELLARLTRDSDGASCRELQRALSRSKFWVHARLDELFEAGKLEVGERAARDKTGRPYHVPVYKLREEKNNV